MIQQERPEGIKDGTLKLEGTNEDDIYSIIEKLLCDNNEYNKMSQAVNAYEDGYASKHIADAIVKRFIKA